MIPSAERVILVGLEHDGVSRWDLEDSLDELRQLADTAGAKVVEGNLARFPGSVAVSVRTGEGIPKLIEELEIRLAAWRMQGRFEIPLTEQALLAEVHSVGHVLDLKYGESAAIITAHVPPKLIGRLSKYDAGPPEK